MSSEPFEPLRADVPRCSSSLALAQREHGEHVPAVQQWATRLQTGYTDLMIDGERLLGRPRGAIGFVGRVDAEALALGERPGANVATPRHVAG